MSHICGATSQASTNTRAAKPTSVPNTVFVSQSEGKGSRHGNHLQQLPVQEAFTARAGFHGVCEQGYYFVSVINTRRAQRIKERPRTVSASSRANTAERDDV